MTALSRRSFSASLALLPLLAASRRSPLAMAQQSTPVLDIPVPIEFPRDDGVHDTSIEWWYFTGNIQTEVSERIGFEYVIFRARPGDLEGFVSHFAITSPGREVFVYDQRILGSEGVMGESAALDLDLQGWTMRGENGNFTLQADSPCAPGNHPSGASCGLIGAAPVGCGTVSAHRITWSRLKSSYR